MDILICQAPPPPPIIANTMRVPEGARFRLSEKACKNVGDLNWPGVRIETFHTRFSASLPIGEKIRSGLACMRASRLTTSKHYRYSSACGGDYVDRRGSTVAVEIKEVGSGASVRERRQKLLDTARRRNIGDNSFIEELVSTVK